MAHTEVSALPEHELPLTDLIYGILGLTFLRHKDDGLSQIPQDSVYSGVKVLSDRHPELFRNVYFTDRGSLPHSKQIEDALFRLAGVLAVMNPRYQYLAFNTGSLPHVEGNMRDWFEPDEREMVEQLAEEFYQEVKHHAVTNA